MTVDMQSTMYVGEEATCWSDTPNRGADVVYGGLKATEQHQLDDAQWAKGMFYVGFTSKIAMLQTREKEL